MTGGATHLEPDPAALAAAAADRWVDTVARAQQDRGVAHVVLTGGTMGSALLEAVRAGGRLGQIDWSALVLWWGDERFLPAGDPDRNARQAHDALLDGVPLAAGNVHVMPAADGPDGEDVDAAAQRYAGELAAAAGPGRPAPVFDLVVLGVGPDAHVASLFPGRPALSETRRTVLAVRDSPKPPPTRTTMTLPTLCSARQVWFLVSGRDKAEAVELARSGAPVQRAPAAGVTGIERTLWLLDEAAAGRLG